jgi:hypothetical protein
MIHHRSDVPQVHQDQRRHNERLARQPLQMRRPDLIQHRVEQAEIWIQNPEPQHADGDRRHDRWQVEQRSENALAGGFRVEQEGERKSQRERSRDRRDGVDRGHPERFPEQRIMKKHPLKVFESDPFRAPRNVPIRKRDDKTRKDRDELPQNKAEKDR